MVTSTSSPGSFPTGLRHETWFQATVLVLAAALIACVDTSSDPSGDAPRLQLVELARFGDDGQPGDGGIGSVDDLAIGEDASIFVLDGMNRNIRVFDERGVLQRTFGRRGRGPGELEQPIALAWGPDGRLWVVDAANARYAVFETNGDLAATYPIEFSEPAMDFLAVGFSDAGLLKTVNLELEGGSLERRGASLVESELVDGEVREIRRFELDFVEWPPIFRHEGDGNVIVQPIPFSSRPIFRLAPDGRLWFAQSREPWVHPWFPAGGLEGEIGRDFDPPRVTDADLERVLEGTEEMREGAPAAFAEFTGLIPATQPHLGGFFLDQAGRVWIMRTRRVDNVARTVDVYDTSGTLVASGQAAVEPDPSPRVRDGMLAGVVRDELGVESIAVYRIQP